MWCLVLLSDTTDFQLRPKISTAEIKATAINIIWEPNMVWNNSDIVYTEVYWTKVYNSDESDVLQTCVDKYLSTVQIANLSPETMYVVWIGVILADSKVVYSNQLHFVTTTVPGKLHAWNVFTDMIF